MGHCKILGAQSVRVSCNEKSFKRRAERNQRASSGWLRSQESPRGCLDRAGREQGPLEERGWEARTERTWVLNAIQGKAHCASKRNPVQVGKASGFSSLRKTGLLKGPKPRATPPPALLCYESPRANQAAPQRNLVLLRRVRNSIPKTEHVLFTRFQIEINFVKMKLIVSLRSPHRLPHLPSPLGVEETLYNRKTPR